MRQQPDWNDQIVDVILLKTPALPGFGWYEFFMSSLVDETTVLQLCLLLGKHQRAQRFVGIVVAQPRTKGCRACVRP